MESGKKMKRRLAIMVCVLLLPVLEPALAERERFSDAIPAEVLALDSAYGLDGEYLDCILFPDTPLGEYCLVLTPWRLYGYIRQNGEWKNWAQLSSLNYQDGTKVYFRRHQAGAAPGMQGTCGLRYPDSRGFDLMQSNPGDHNSVVMMMQFRWEGEDLRLVGWQAGEAGQFALWQEGLWVYYDSATGERLGGARLDRLAEYGLMADTRELPLTLADARKMEPVTQAAAETLFPGWTMDSYALYNWGREASAGYYRIEDGMLTIRRVVLTSDAGGVARQADTLPIPLSEAFSKRLQTEAADTLLDTSGNGDTFLTDAAFDRAKIPVTDTVLQNDLQTHGLMLLTEDASGVRRLRWVERDGAGYSVRSSQPLPDDTVLDLFHCGDGAVSLEWDAQYSQCSASRAADGSWTLGWATMDGMDSFMFGTLYCGVQQYAVLNGTDAILVGSHPWGDLFSLDLTQLPGSTEEAAAGLDREGWAVVNNPDPADRLHLRAQPEASAESLGKFYNRTPVRVLERRDGWARVRIGTDGRLEGWMMSKYLAFGDAMDAVDSASPDLTLREGYANSALFAAPAMRETTGVYYGSGTWIVGVAGDGLYILLDFEGNTGYLPQSWFWSGNG